MTEEDTKMMDEVFEEIVPLLENDELRHRGVVIVRTRDDILSKMKGGGSDG